MSVKVHLMWNSKMLIDGGGDFLVATSLLEASNLVVLKACQIKQLEKAPNSHLIFNFKIMIQHALMYDINHIAYQESSVIHSNANLGVHGQGLLNLSGPGDLIEAQRLILSLFYSINVSKIWPCISLACFL